MKPFAEHFGDRYDVYPRPPDLPASLDTVDFVIRQSDIAAIGVGLKQEKSETKIDYHGVWAKEPPFAWFIPYRMVLQFRGTFASNPMMDEVRDFIATGLEQRLTAAGEVTPLPPAD